VASYGDITMLRRTATIAAAVVFVALAAGCQNAADSSGGAPRTAAPAPPEPPGTDPVTVRFYKDPTPVVPFAIQTLDGRRMTSAELAGKVVLVNFWATWCGPCKAEIPDLVALQEKYRDQLVILGISEDEEPPEVVKRFAAEHKINYPVAMATEDVRKAFPGVAALPTSFFLDREGRVVQKHVGLLDRTRTEHETRSLAGLPTRATVELVEPDQPVGLANAAQAKEIPGVDLSALSASRRVEVLQRLNTEACSCGCGLTVAKCRIDDPACGVSLPLARRIVTEMSAGSSQD
jgi:thiol-disulfide isomerase/thioredoxin